MPYIIYSGFSVHILVWQFENLGGPKLILTRRKYLDTAILDVQVREGEVTVWGWQVQSLYKL